MPSLSLAFFSCAKFLSVETKLVHPHTNKEEFISGSDSSRRVFYEVKVIMGSVANPKAWVPIPYTNIRDCSQGFCTFYCPQWCFLVFPPPPTAVLFTDHNSALKLSPFVIAIIAILACAVLLVSYYALISKYHHGSVDPAQRRSIGRNEDDLSSQFDSLHDPSVRLAWQVETMGLDESVIRSIAVCSYKKGVGLIEGTCSVCLSEFEEDESIRLLPKCTHAFHIPCIDTWLESHSSCPLCRSEIVFMGTFPIASPLLLDREVSPPPPQIDEPTDEVREANTGEKGGGLTSVENPTSKLPSRVRSDLGSIRDTIIEIEEDRTQKIRRTMSMDHFYQVRLSASEFVGVYQNESAQAGHSDCGGSSQDLACRPHGKMAQTKMKRSLSSDRLPISGRGILSSGTIPGRNRSSTGVSIFK